MFIEPYLGNVTIFGGNFEPRSWMFCNGQLLSIAQYTALFALIGITYGGDGQNTFGLPDLRSRVAVHAGQGPGLNNYVLGEMAGSENVTVLSIQLPVHTHANAGFTVKQGINTGNGTTDNPQNGYPAAGPAIYNNAPDGTTMGAYSSIGTTTIAGSSQPLPIIQPYLAMSYIIAVEGIFPSRN